MENIPRHDALLAGLRFAVWVFTRGREFQNEVQQFCDCLGLAWHEVHAAQQEDDTGTDAKYLIGDTLGKRSPGRYAWFEVGRHSMLLLNVTGGRSPDSLFEIAIASFREHLFEAGIDAMDVEVLVRLARELGEGNWAAREKKLAKFLNVLRDLARHHERGAGLSSMAGIAGKSSASKSAGGSRRSVSLPGMASSVSAALAAVLGVGYYVQVLRPSSLGLMEVSFLALCLLAVAFGRHAMFRWLPSVKGGWLGAGQRAK